MHHPMMSVAEEYEVLEVGVPAVPSMEEVVPVNLQMYVDNE